MAKLRFARTQMLVDLVAPGLTTRGGVVEENFGLGFSIEVEGPGLGPDDEVVSVITRDTEQRHKFAWEKR